MRKYMSTFKIKNTQMGFTFVELAIVLLIASILIGGIALGREFIENAKIKSMIDDFENFEQAHYLYIKRTGLPPGSSSGYDQWGGGGVNEIEDSYFNDLIAEGLIPAKKTGELHIKHAYGDRWGASSRKTTNAFIEGPQICAWNVPVWVAEQIDIKLDDGTPFTGNVLTGRPDTGNAVVLTLSYADARNGLYGTRYDYVVCRGL